MNGAIFDVLPAMDLLLSQLEQAKVTYRTTNPRLASCINLAWKKLDEYYQLSDSSPAYVAAVVLDPRMKFQYFEKRWASHPDWVITAKERIRGSFEEYKERYNFALPPDSYSKSPTTPSTLMKWKFGSAALSENSIDELDHYLSTELERGHVNPRDWWHINGPRFPVIETMAWDIMAIPAMSAELERVFSGYLPNYIFIADNRTKLMITDNQNRLNPDIIEAGKCYIAWIKSGLLVATS